MTTMTRQRLWWRRWQRWYRRRGRDTCRWQYDWVLGQHVLILTGVRPRIFWVIDSTPPHRRRLGRAVPTGTPKGRSRVRVCGHHVTEGMVIDLELKGRHLGRYCFYRGVWHPYWGQVSRGQPITAQTYAPIDPAFLRMTKEKDWRHQESLALQGG